MKSTKSKIIIAMLVIAFVLVSVVATIAIVFAMQQQNISTSLNISYTAVDIDGSVSGTYKVGGVTKDLQPNADPRHIGGTNNNALLFFANDTGNAGTLEFPEEDSKIEFTVQNSSMVMQYTFTNNGDVHYIASMSFDAELKYENMKVEYSIDGTTYSEDRYAVVVPANSTGKNYWIRISIDELTKNASFSGDFDWLLDACDEQSKEYLSYTSIEMQGSNGVYSVSVVPGDMTADVVIPKDVNGNPVTKISSNYSITQEQKDLIRSVYIPDTVTEIGSSAFSGYTNLEEVIFEQNEQAEVSALETTGLLTINSFAFGYCSSLKEFIIPNTVTSIYNTTFSNCSGLEKIEVVSGNTKYHSSGNCIIESASNTLILGCKTSVIPADGSVTTIGSYSFINCLDLTEISIPNTVTLIQYSAFNGCENLTNIIIPNSVTVLEHSVFRNCTRLTSIAISNKLTSIGDAAFADCPELTSIIVEEGNTKYHSTGNCLIETDTKNLILGCKTSVIPTDGSVTSVGNFAFCGCAGLTEIIIPENITSIGNSAFSSCTGLTEISIPNTVTSIGNSAFGGCIGLTEIIIPENVTIIGDAAFYGCNGLASVTFEITEGWKERSTTLGVYFYNDISSEKVSDSAKMAEVLRMYNNIAYVKQ